ncbi:MAG: 50S ribosomal protein L25 [Phycisphaerales bacterium]|nr:50S ribosomal protein L25 [Phycisphaerales bacterium]NNM25920.1 50S ribosomal protein L25 [Phycisphaerales bacterium]
MKHETPTISATLRERVGTRYCRRLRQQGKLPGVIYGHKTDPVSVAVDEKTLLPLLRLGAHAMYVEIEGRPRETCLVKDLQFGYLGDNVIHVDFTRVDLQEEVTVNVHLAFFGSAAEAQKADAILQQDATELSVTCKVSEIPGEIRVDLSQMEGNHLTAGEIELPEGLVLADDPQTIVASVTFAHPEEEAVGEEADVAADGAEPEVITEAKADEEAG